MTPLFVFYCLLFAILAVHEMDSVLNEEWALFRLPGGSSFFLVIHLPLFACLMIAAAGVYRGSFAGRLTAVVLGSAGIIGFLLHGYFLLRGDRRFRSPVSLMLLALMPAFGLATILAAV